MAAAFLQVTVDGRDHAQVLVPDQIGERLQIHTAYDRVADVAMPQAVGRELDSQSLRQSLAPLGQRLGRPGLVTVEEQRPGGASAGDVGPVRRPRRLGE